MVLLSNVTADTLHMKNGKVLEGELISEDADTVVFETQGMKMNLTRAAVEKIETASDVENKVMQAEQLANSGNHGRAFEIYNALLAGGEPDEARHREIQARRQALINQELEDTKKEFARYARQGEYAECADRVKEYRQGPSRSELESIACKIYEATMRLEAAYDYADKKNPEQAAAQLEKLEAMDVDTSSIYDQLGMLYFHSGQYEKATPYLEQALETSPDSPGLLACLVRSMVEAKEHEALMQKWEQMEAKGQTQSANASIRNDVGKAYRVMAFRKLEDGEKEAAEKLFDRGMELSVKQLALYNEAAQFYAKANDEAKADQMRAEADRLSKLAHKLGQEDQIAAETFSVQWLNKPRGEAYSIIGGSDTSTNSSGSNNFSFGKQ